jgi:hypothetical protein
VAKRATGPPGLQVRVAVRRRRFVDLVDQPTVEALVVGHGLASALRHLTLATPAAAVMPSRPDPRS